MTRSSINLVRFAGMCAGLDTETKALSRMKILPLVMKKLSEIRVFVLSMKDTNKHPVGVPRVQLDGFLRMTQTELLEVFGVNSPNKLTLTLRKAVTVVSRIHKGSDSYRVIGEKVGVLIKRLRPLYVDQLEREAAVAKRRSEREMLAKRFTVLTIGKAFPESLETSQILSIVSELRSDAETDALFLMDEVNELAFRHPDVKRISDANLVAFVARLERRINALREVQPVKYSTFAEKFDRRAATMQ